MTSKSYFLQWKCFKTNLLEAFRDFYNEDDFFDVTLVSEDDKQIQAHKVILSAGSPLFRGILKRNPHSNPLLYLKGVRYSDLVCILNFMYHGEVNVAADHLTSFLAVAEELNVNGLSTNNSHSTSLASQSVNESRSNTGEGEVAIDTESKVEASKVYLDEKGDGEKEEEEKEDEEEESMDAEHSEIVTSDPGDKSLAVAEDLNVKGLDTNNGHSTSSASQSLNSPSSGSGDVEVAVKIECNRVEDPEVHLDEEGDGKEEEEQRMEAEQESFAAGDNDGGQDEDEAEEGDLKKKTKKSKKGVATEEDISKILSTYKGSGTRNFLRMEGDIYCCKKCDYTSFTRQCVKDHIDNIHSTSLYECPVCKRKEYKNLRSLRSHYNYTHKNKSRVPKRRKKIFKKNVSANVEQNYEILKNNRSEGNDDIYSADGFEYVKHYEMDEKLYLQCRLYKSKSSRCKGRAILELESKRFFRTISHTCVQTK